MADLPLRLSAINELINAHHDRIDALDELCASIGNLNTVSTKTHQVFMLGFASWSAQALVVLLQIEKDRLESLSIKEDKPS